RDEIAVNVAASNNLGKGSGRHKEQVNIPSRDEIRGVFARLDEWSEQEDQAKAKAWRRWRALFHVAVHTGMRASEIRGLPWGAVDLDSGQIEIRQRADETGTIGSPKSAAARRKIDIPAALVSMLREWKLEAPRSALVFANRAGAPENLANIHNRAWIPLQ